MRRQPGLDRHRLAKTKVTQLLGMQPLQPGALLADFPQGSGQALGVAGELNTGGIGQHLPLTGNRRLDQAPHEQPRISHQPDGQAQQPNHRQRVAFPATVITAGQGPHQEAAQLADGTKTLYDGVTTLNDGAGQLSDGTVRLNDGLNQFNEEGISKLTGALDEEQIHGLKSVLDEMTSRLEDYTSFAGKSEDASGSVKFIYKTGETVAAADVTAETTADVQEGNFFTRLWQRIVNLFKF